MAHEYLLLDVTRKTSKRGTGDYIYEVSFVDLDDLQDYVTIVDPTMRNWTRCNWQLICEGTTPYGAYSGLIRTARKTQQNTPVISADSYPQLICMMTANEIVKVIEHRTLQLRMQ